MGLFGKSVSDQEWLDLIKPYYQALLPITTALNDAVANDFAQGRGSVKDEVNAIKDALSELPDFYGALKNLPSPKSSEACRAKNKMESAIKCYIDGAKQGKYFFQNELGRPGEIMRQKGVMGRVAGANLVAQRSFFLELVKSAQKSMKEASDYLSHHMSA